MSSRKPDPGSSLFVKAFWVIRHRPTHALSQIRTYLTFWIQHQLWTLFPSPGIELERNVRLQKRRCLMAEAPSAQIRIGAHSLIFENARIEAFGEGRIEIGEDSILSDVRINSRGKITIGKRFLGAWGLFIQDCESHPVNSEQRGLQSQISCRNFSPSWKAPGDSKLPQLDWNPKPGTIEIGDNVWIGANCSVFKNVKIGSGCIVASGSVVTAGEYPEKSLIAGNPARVVKTIS